MLWKANRNEQNEPIKIFLCLFHMIHTCRLAWLTFYKSLGCRLININFYDWLFIWVLLVLFALSIYWWQFHSLHLICLVFDASSNAECPFHIFICIRYLFLLHFDLKNCSSKENELIEMKVNFSAFHYSTEQKKKTK